MQRRIEVLGTVVEVDSIATASVYRKRPTFIEACGCLACQNFVAACSMLPEDLRTLFDTLGVDPRKEEGDIGHFGRLEDGMHLYNGFYHANGRIIEQGPPMEWSFEDKPYVALTTSCSLVTEDFPRPVFQVDVMVKLPWVLREPWGE